jgi:hypothetical protein
MKVQDLRQKNLTFLSGACVFVLIILLTSTFISEVAAQQAAVRVVPASYTVPNVGLTFTVNVTVENVEDLYGWELKLYYPNNVLNGTSATEGSFLKTGGIPTAFLVTQFIDSYNATNGLLNVLCLRTGDVPGANGNGTLATITFTSTSRGGMEILHLADVKLSDSNTTMIPSITADGEVTVIPEFPAALILPILIASTIVAITLRKKMINCREMFQSV